ncbi:MAG: AbgT family transporter [Balneolales bacterium]|nr:AbgT family transporter [Balneolales bacterium]
MSKSDHPVQPDIARNDIKNEKNWFTRFLNFVEWLGNLLPHPVTLFALFCAGVILISGVAEWLDWSVSDPRDRTGATIIEPVSLLNADGFRMIVANLVTNFTSFAPLGTVLVALLGVGVAEHSGLIKAAIRGIVLAALNASPTIKETDSKLIKLIKKPFVFVMNPKILVTFAVVFSGIISNTASELGYVVLVPLGAVVFYSLGRHPLAGLAAAFAGVSGGYSANLLLGTIDPLLAGLTEEAARLVDDTYVVHAAVNYYFMFLSVFVISFAGTFVTIKIVEPKLGPYDPNIAMDKLDTNTGLEPLTPQERKGIFWATMSTLFFFGLLALTVIPDWGLLRSQNPDDVVFPANIRPFLNGIVAIIFIGFIIPGIVFGRITGTIKTDRDVIDGMAKSMATLGLYIVIVFFAAQFVSYFNWTNLGQILAVNGANFLQNANLDGPVVFIFFIFISGFVNLMLGSASAQWAVTAPIFVPMLMYIGYSPEVIQAAYRIGDSVTNIITPMMSYFGLILAFANKYDKNLGIGTIISMMLPYSIFFYIGWIALFYIWIFLLGMPPGPGAAIYYDFGG